MLTKEGCMLDERVQDILFDFDAVDNKEAFFKFFNVDEFGNIIKAIYGEKLKILDLLNKVDELLREARLSADIIRRTKNMKYLRDGYFNGVLVDTAKVSADIESLLKTVQNPINKFGKISASVKTLASFLLDKALKEKPRVANKMRENQRCFKCYARLDKTTPNNLDMCPSCFTKTDLGKKEERGNSPTKRSISSKMQSRECTIIENNEKEEEDENVEDNQIVQEILEQQLSKKSIDIVVPPNSRKRIEVNVLPDVKKAVPSRTDKVDASSKKSIDVLPDVKIPVPFRTDRVDADAIRSRNKRLDNMVLRIDSKSSQGKRPIVTREDAEYNRQDSYLNVQQYRSNNGSQTER